MTSTVIYGRIALLKKELGLSTCEFNKRILKIIEDNALDIRVTKTMLNNWQTALTSNKTQVYPPAGAMACIAEALETNIDYLLGRHHVKAMRNDRVLISFRYKQCDEDYKQMHGGKTLLNDKIIYTQWLNRIVQGTTPYSNLKLGPFVKVADATGLTVDYVLGLSDIKSWQPYCVAHSMWKCLPQGTLLLTEKQQIWGVEKGGTSATTLDGNKKISLDELMAMHPKIIRQITTW